MRFGRHRFLIILLFAALPVVSIFALVQTPFVSELILDFSLRLVRFRTGIRIDAESWEVKPLQFSAALANIRVDAGPLSVSAPAVEVWVSPLYLLLGEVHLNDLEIDRPFVRGRLPDELKDDNDDGTFWRELFKKDVPTEAGRKVREVVDLISQRNLYLEKVSLDRARIEIEEMSCDELTVELENLGAGQLHLEWNLLGAGVPGKVQSVESFKGAFGLLKASSEPGPNGKPIDRFSLVVTGFEAKLGGEKGSLVQASGSWPGESRVMLAAELPEVQAWLRDSPGIGDIGVKEMKGRVKSDLTLKTGTRGLLSYAGALRTEGLSVDEFVPNRIDAAFEGAPDRLRISRLVIDLPRALGDRANWVHQIASKDLLIEDNKLKGELTLNEAGLCGVLLAAGQVECHAGVRVSGVIPIAGTLDPLELDARPSLTIGEGEVHTDPIIFKKDSRLLGVKPASITGTLQVLAKRLFLKDIRMTWGADSFAEVDGEIAYEPTVVGLDIASTKADFKGLLTDFLDLEVRGIADLNARVDYAEKIARADGRTRVRARINMINAGVEGQNFGNLIGTANYQKNELILGPLRLINGGGSATLNGKISPRTAGSYLEIAGDLRRLELRAVSPESGSEIFNGFATGRIALAGYTNNKSPEFLSGPFNLEVDNFRVFGVPFQRGKVQAVYQTRKLLFTDVSAERNKYRVNMSGILNPEGGSELLFSSTNFPVRELGVEPKLKIFQKGLVSIDGFWRPSKGWELKGKATQLRVAGRDIPDGIVKMGGEDDTFRFDLRFGDILGFNISSRDIPGSQVVKRSISATAEDLGLYLAFAYMKEWESTYPLTTAGKVSFKTEEDSGRIEVNDLRLLSTDIGSSAPPEVLNLPGKRSVSWNTNGVVNNDFGGKDVDLVLEGGPGAKSLSARYNLDLRVLDLLVPVFKFQSGRLVGKATLPLPMRIPAIGATAEIRAGSVFLDSLGHSIDSVKGGVEVNRGNLYLRSLTGSMGAGEVRAEGVYRLDPANPVLSLQVALDRAHLVLLDDVPVDVTGEVVLRGEKTPYSLSGRVQTANMLYSKEFNQASTLPDLAVTPSIRFALDVELGNDVVVRNALADMELGGRLLVGGTDLEPTMQGRILLQRGAVIANENRFQVVQGYVDFPGGPTLDPIINLQASTQVQSQNQNYKIDLRAQGPVANLNIDFASDPPLANADIVSLLAFGVLNSESSETTAVGSTDLIGAARVEALQMIFGKAIGSNIDRTTGFQVRLRAEQDTKQQEFIPKVTVERRLSDRVRATYGQSIDATKEQRDLKVDYRLLNNMNLSGVWEEKENNESSVGVDLRFRFDIK